MRWIYAFDPNRSQTILAQVDRDNGVVRLASIMDDAFFFVKEAEPIKKIESQGRIIALIAQQTTECGYFIRDYAMNKKFCMLGSPLRVKVKIIFIARGTSSQE